MPKVSVIIPAFNEAKTIGSVIEVAKECDLVDEVIVVSDGSTDDTAAVAGAAGAKVIDLSTNRGKAGAMEAGVQVAQNNIICFLDADLKNFTDDILCRIILPVLEGRYDMYAVIFGRKIPGFNWLTPHLPIISGNRALTKEVWRLVPEKYKVKFQIEIALDIFAKRAYKICGAQSYPGFSQYIKEEKYGFWVGFWRRLKMSMQLVGVFIKLFWNK